MATLESHDATDVAGDVQEGRLLHSHQRFGHLAYDTIERTEKETPSSIRLTSKRRAA
uniref:Integrase n=1 Tax=Peronospora matthiolae TaxID=2874970 RepID=A0AAV1TLY2_9STRA